MVTTTSFAKHASLTAIATLALLTLAPTTKAEEPKTQTASTLAPIEPAKTTPTFRVHHAARSTAAPGERLELLATLDHAEQIRSCIVVYQTATGDEKSVPFQRGGTEGYIAVIPAEAIRAPGISYTIEVEQLDGKRLSIFATRNHKHNVSVIEDATDVREKALLARLGGRRSIISAGGEYVGFGRTTGATPIPCAANQGALCKEGDLVTPAVDEQYYRAEAAYTYRPLRLISEFGFRLGLLRGRSLVPLSELDATRYEVGLNYGAARVRLQLLDLWHMEAEVLTSITEIGFSIGFGSTALIGDPYGTKLLLGFETLGLGSSASFGTRFFTRLDLVPNDRWTISPIIEVTDMPNAETYGVRLLTELGLSLGNGFTLQLRGGYSARRSTSGGPAAGGSVGYAF